MKINIRNGSVFYKGQMQTLDLIIEEGKIVQIGESLTEIETETDKDEQIYDAKGMMVVPGFIDLHTHGASGVDVNAATSEGFEKIGHFFALQGTTSWLCSILSDTKEQTEEAIRQARAHQKKHENCANLMGIHLEGPFLASEYKGAMPEHLLIKPDLALLEEYQNLAEGEIRYITVSPEVEGVKEAIPSIIKMGMVVAIGHSGANYDRAMECIKQGAAAATHTFNAMKLFHQHEPAIMGAVLESDVYCEAICDGRHLHPATVRLLLKAKGMQRVVAVTDSIMAAGLPDGEYQLGVNAVIVKDGDAKLKVGDSRAGSTLTTNQALKNIMKFTGKPIEEVLPLMTENPAKLMGKSDCIGTLEVGKDADIVILDENYCVKDTFVKGQPIIR